MNQRLTIGLVVGLLVCFAGARLLREERSRTQPPSSAESFVAEAEPTQLTRPELASEPPSPARAEVAPEPPVSPERSRKRRGVRKKTKDAVVRVRVVAAASSEPIVDAFVTLLPPLGGRGPVRRTGADGTVECPVHSGQALELLVEGRPPREGVLRRDVEPLRAGEQRELEVRLSVGGGLFQGRVVERASGAPIAGARVRLLGEWSFFDSVEDLSTDAAGVFELVFSRSLMIELAIEADGFGPAAGRLDPGHESPAQAQVFRLERSASIRGRVRDGEGAPLASIRVTARYELGDVRQPLPGPGNHSESTDALSDASGDFRIEGLPARTKLVLLAHEWGEGKTARKASWSRTLALAPGEERELEIALHAEVALTGLVLDPEGRPVEGLVLGLTAAGDPPHASERISADATLVANCVTSSDGSFRFRPMPPGPWYVGPLPGGPFLARLRFIDLAPEPAATHVVLRVERGRFIRGQVVRSAGRTLPSGTVEARSGGVVVARCSFDPGGAFELGPLAEGTHALLATTRLLASEPVEARAGEDGVVLSLKRAGGILRVRVAGAQDKGRSPRVLLVPRASPSVTHAVSPQEDGDYFFHSLAPGLYDFFVHDAEGGFGALSGLRPGAGDTLHEVTLAERSALLRVTDLRAGSAESVVRVLRAGGTVGRGQIHPGTSTALRVPTGTLVVELLASAPVSGDSAAPTRTQTVWIAAGEEREVVFD